MKSVHLFIYLFIYLFSFSQTPVKWNIKYSPDKNKIVFNAVIDSSWHLYALDVPHPDEGPLPTIVEFEKQKNYLLKGKFFKKNQLLGTIKGLVLM